MFNFFSSLFVPVCCADRSDFCWPLQFFNVSLCFSSSITVLPIHSRRSKLVPLDGGGEWCCRTKWDSPFTPLAVTEPLSENSACALWSAELSSAESGQSICCAIQSAARARTAGNRKYDHNIIWNMMIRSSLLCTLGGWGGVVEHIIVTHIFSC